MELLEVERSAGPVDSRTLYPVMETNTEEEKGRPVGLRLMNWEETREKKKEKEEKEPY
jgi:hypothetical protein